MFVCLFVCFCTGWSCMFTCLSILTFACGWVIRPLPSPVGKATKRPMPYPQIVPCWAFQHHHRTKFSQPTRQQTVGHVIWQYALNAGAVDRWKIKCNKNTIKFIKNIHFRFSRLQAHNFYHILSTQTISLIKMYYITMFYN